MNLRSLLQVQQGSELTKYPHSSKIREGNQSRVKGFCTDTQSYVLQQWSSLYYLYLASALTIAKARIQMLKYTFMRMFLDSEY